MCHPHLTSPITRERDRKGEGRNPTRYDGSDEGSAINEGDPWRPINVFVHGPGQISQIVKCSIYDAGSWVEDIYYHYDALGNVMGYSDSNASAIVYEMDAFGNRITNSSTWETMTSVGPKEHLTGKMLDDDTGLYYFHARWYDPQVGRLIGRDPASGSDENKYHFSMSNPISAVDPDGRKPYFCTKSDRNEQMYGLIGELQNEVARVNRWNWGERPSGCVSWSEYLSAAGNRFLDENYGAKQCWRGRAIGGYTAHEWNNRHTGECETITGVRHQVSEWQPKCGYDWQPWEHSDNTVFDAWNPWTPGSGKGCLRQYTMGEFREEFPLHSPAR